MQVFKNETTNTTSGIFRFDGDGERTVIIEGTMGGATVDFEFSANSDAGPVPDPLKWVADTNSSYTAPGVYRFVVSPHVLFRAVITGGTAATITVGVF